MSNKRVSKYVGLLAGGLAIGLFSIGFPVADEPGVSSNGSFELGDGSVPLEPGAADIVGSLLQDGPDWNDLFDADRGLKDELDESGHPVPNGVPDYLDGWGHVRARRDVAFMSDPVGDGTDPAGELGNAYAYTLFDSARRLVLYAGIERLPATTSDLLLEFNRRLFSVGPDGSIIGWRSPGDLQIELRFNSGTLAAMHVRRLDADAGWVELETLPVDPQQATEQCNASGSACIVCNGQSINAGAWPSYDDAGNPVAELATESFVELGVNLGALFGADTYWNYYSTRYTSFRISTAGDAGFATFVRAARLAQ